MRRRRKMTKMDKRLVGVLLGVNILYRIYQGYTQYDKAGSDKAEYDKDGYNKDGYDRTGYNRKGYNKDGYNIAGYDEYGFDRNGLDFSGKSVEDIQNDLICNQENLRKAKKQLKKTIGKRQLANCVI
jgi:hypothetical protein